MDREPVTSMTIVVDDLGEARETVARCGRNLREGSGKALSHRKTRNLLKTLGISQCPERHRCWAVGGAVGGVSLGLA